MKRELKEEVVWKVATRNDGDGVGWVLKNRGHLIKFSIQILKYRLLA
jgi:hypothetical protein